MFKFGLYLLCSLSIWSLWNGCLAMDHQSAYVCLVDDPNPNDDSSCLTTLQPMLNQINSRLDKSNKKVDILESQQAEVKLQLQEVLTAQTRLEAQLQAFLEAQQATLRLTRHLIMCNVPSNFELIGSRYFLIVESLKDWRSAASFCNQNRGYLASIQSQEELIAISAKLKNLFPYWLGINDQQTEGHYISVASNKTAEVLKWSSSQSGDQNHKQNCVYLLEGSMSSFMCDFTTYFICQADNEV